jgi:hypothetical protein
MQDVHSAGSNRLDVPCLACLPLSLPADLGQVIPEPFRQRVFRQERLEVACLRIFPGIAGSEREGTIPGAMLR